MAGEPYRTPTAESQAVQDAGTKIADALRDTLVSEIGKHASSADAIILLADAIRDAGNKIAAALTERKCVILPEAPPCFVSPPAPKETKSFGQH